MVVYEALTCLPSSSRQGCQAAAMAKSVRVVVSPPPVFLLLTARVCSGMMGDGWGKGEER